MPDYKAMYIKLFAVHCDVMDMLQEVGKETEQMAMDADFLNFPKPKQTGKPPQDSEEKAEE